MSTKPKRARLPPTDIILTRRKLAQLNTRELRNQDVSRQKISRMTQLLRSTKPQARSPRKKANEYYPDKLKRKLEAKKVVLKPKHELKVVAVGSKRKGVPQKGLHLKSPPSKRSKPVWSKSEQSEIQPKKLMTKIQSQLSIEEMVRQTDSEMLNDEDFLEILTCESPVWWEDPPDEGYCEDAIYRRVKVEPNRESDSETSDLKSRESPNKTLSLSHRENYLEKSNTKCSEATEQALLHGENDSEKYQLKCNKSTEKSLSHRKSDAEESNSKCSESTEQVLSHRENDSEKSNLKYSESTEQVLSRSENDLEKSNPKRSKSTEQVLSHRENYSDKLNPKCSESTEQILSDATEKLTIPQRKENDEKFMKKRSKLENLLGNIKTKLTPQIYGKLDDKIISNQNITESNKHLTGKNISRNKDVFETKLDVIKVSRNKDDCETKVDVIIVSRNKDDSETNVDVIEISRDFDNCETNFDVIKVSRNKDDRETKVDVIKVSRNKDDSERKVNVIEVSRDKDDCETNDDVNKVSRNKDNCETKVDVIKVSRSKDDFQRKVDVIEVSRDKDDCETNVDVIQVSRNKDDSERKVNVIEVSRDKDDSKTNDDVIKVSRNKDNCETKVDVIKVSRNKDDCQRKVDVIKVFRDKDDCETNGDVIQVSRNKDNCETNVDVIKVLQNNKPREKRQSGSTEGDDPFSNLRDDDILRDLENMDIPVEPTDNLDEAAKSSDDCVIIDTPTSSKTIVTDKELNKLDPKIKNKIKIRNEYLNILRKKNVINTADEKDAIKIKKESEELPLSINKVQKETSSSPLSQRSISEDTTDSISVVSREIDSISDTNVHFIDEDSVSIQSNKDLDAKIYEKTEEKVPQSINKSNLKANGAHNCLTVYKIITRDEIAMNVIKKGTTDGKLNSFYKTFKNNCNRKPNSNKPLEENADESNQVIEEVRKQIKNDDVTRDLNTKLLKIVPGSKYFAESSKNSHRNETRK